MHGLSLLPSLSGSLSIRRGFVESSMNIGPGATLFPGLLVTYPDNLSIGERIFVNRNVFLNALAPIRIGTLCSSDRTL